MLGIKDGMKVTMIMMNKKAEYEKWMEQYDENFEYHCDKHQLKLLEDTWNLAWDLGHSAGVQAEREANAPVTIVECGGLSDYYKAKKRGHYTGGHE